MTRRVTRGITVFLPVLLELFPFALPLPSFFPLCLNPLVCTFAALELPPFFWVVVVGGGPKSTIRAGAAPQQGRGISARLTGSVSRRVPPGCAPRLCYLRVGAASEAGGTGGGAFVEFT